MKRLIVAVGDWKSIRNAVLNTTFALNKNANDRFEILTFKKFANFAKNICGVEKVHSIDLEAIDKNSTCSFISDAFSFNTMLSALGPILEEEYSDIINCSTSLVGANIATAISKMKNLNVIGNTMSAAQTILSSDIWNMIDSAAHQYFKFAPINKSDIAHQNCRASIDDFSMSLMASEKAYERINSVINRIRSANVEDCKIIGIPVIDMNNLRTLSFDRLVSVIDQLLEDRSYLPVIITTKAERDNVMVRELNKNFSNTLITIEANEESLIAALSSVDAIIGVDNFATSIADFAGTPVLSIHASFRKMLEANFVNQGQLELIASNQMDAEEFGRDVHHALNHLVGLEMSAEFISSKSVIFTTRRDNFGIFFEQIAGVTLENKNIIYNVIRASVANYSVNKIDLDKMIERENFSTAALKAWAHTERQLITDISRDLLGALRSLLRTQKDIKLVNEFITSLDKLMIHEESTSLSSFAASLFHARIDNITSNHIQESVKAMEKALYCLKNDLQNSLSILKHVEDYVERKTKEDMVERITTRSAEL